MGASKRGRPDAEHVGSRRRDVFFEPGMMADGRTRLAVVSIGACSIVATCLVLLETSRYGPGLSGDSVNYIGAARHLLNGEGFCTYGGGPYAHWPPLLPSVLALLGLTGLDLVRLAGLFNAGVCGLTVAVCGLWLLQSSKSRILPVLGTIAVVSPVALLSRFVWSEPLFILFVVVFLWQMGRYLSSARTGRLVGAAVLAALACLTRYIGIAVPATGCLLVLVALGAPLRRRIAACFLLGSIATLPLALWLVRNLLVSGTLTGERWPSEVGLLENVSRTGEVMGSMLLPPKLAALCPGAAWFIGLAAASVGMVLFALYRSHRRGEDWRHSPALSPLAFCGVYTGSVVVCATLVAFDPLNRRLLSPLCAPGTVLGFLVLDEVLFGGAREVLDGREGRDFCAIRAARAIVVMAVVLWLSVVSARTSVQVRSFLRTGAGDYSSRQWQESETIAYLRAHDVREPVFSNVPKAVYILTGKRATLPPRWPPRAGPGGIGDAGPTEFRPPSSSGEDWTLVWFGKMNMTAVYDPSGVPGFGDMTRVAVFPDGSVYALRAAPRKRALQD